MPICTWYQSCQCRPTLEWFDKSKALAPGKHAHNKVFIIAEAGVNHNGSLATAFKLIDEAKKCKADAIKFQTWKTGNVVIKKAPKAKYQIKKNNIQETQFEMLKKLELSYKDFIKIKRYCDKLKIIFLSTADEIESALFLKPLVSSDV